MEDRIRKFVVEDAKRFPQGPFKFFSYGTAGFRDRSSVLDCVIFRAALISTLRSTCAKSAIGVVLTASHNPECDNGVKFVDRNGEMLIPQWEEVASLLGNAKNDELLKDALSIVERFQLSDVSDYQPTILIAKDTRPSGDHLRQILVDGLEIFGVRYHDYGLLTTPQLHYMVKCTNTNGAYGEPTEEGYCKKLSKAFEALLSKNVSKPLLKLDAANGVGAGRAKKLSEYIGHLLDIQVYNDGSDGRLNFKCGADHVKSTQSPPTGSEIIQGATYVSFDGDADRIVFFYFKEGCESFKLLDGDKIACLMAMFIKQSLVKIGINLKMSVIQTAYANGSSTKYLTDVLGIPVTCTKTGVKHLQRRAQDFDIGVFFEANGHGTVLYSDNAIETIKQSLSSSRLSESEHEVAVKLLHFIELTNQTTGDSISDMLMVQAILSNQKWKCSDWDGLYRELPNRQLTLKVADRSVITTADVERKCVNPEGLQEAINQLVAKIHNGRSFVRPSGTEDIVRVYAEAETQELADSLALSVCKKTYELAGGVGSLPTIN